MRELESRDMNKMKDEEGARWRSEWKELELGETREDGRGKGVECIVTKI